MHIHLQNTYINVYIHILCMHINMLFIHIIYYIIYIAGIVYIKGASEVILSRCTHYINEHGEICILTNNIRIQLEKSINDMAKRALRTIILGTILLYYLLHYIIFIPLFLALFSYYFTYITSYFYVIYTPYYCAILLLF